MGRRLDITAEIEALLRQRVDANIETSNVAVFRATAVTTIPLRRRGGLFQGARIQRDMLEGMVGYVAAGNTVPIKIQHRADDLPNGQVFDAELVNRSDGQTEVQVLFMLPVGASETIDTYIAQLDAGVVREVSIGALSKQILCSECNFDYMGPEASWEHHYELTCENGHTIGKDGVHVKLQGFSDWFELSLVDRGASPGATIHSKPKLSQAASERLAANDVPVGMLVLYASNGSTEVSTEEKPKMSEAANQSDLATKVVELSEKFAGAKADLVVALNERDSFKRKVETLEAQLNARGEELTQIQASLEAAKTAQDALVAFLSEQLQAARVALGQKAGDTPKDPEALVAALKETGLKIHQMFGVSGVSQPADSGTGTETKARDDYEQRRRLAARGKL